MSRATKAALAEARRLCTLAMEPLWKPAPHIKGRHTPPDLRVAHQREARTAAYAWLSRQVGATIGTFDQLKDLELMRRAYAAAMRATIFTVEADPHFASTPYGAAMIAAERDRQDGIDAEFGHLVAFRKAQQDKRRPRETPADPNREFKELVAGDVAAWREA